MRPFAELGALIEARWREQNYDERSFPAIAAQALRELKLVEKVDPWDIIRWVHQTPDLPRQMNLEATFGNPPITLYVGPKFYIDVYFWLDGTTSIHQHSFSGAFQLLLGSSVHSKYGFQQEMEINPQFRIGKLLLENISLLAKGDIREILPGAAFIHSLFHLERPSATITVRTNIPGAGVQFAYLKPSLAHDPFSTDPSLKRKLQTVKLLLEMKHLESDRFIGDLIDSSDFQTTYAVLDQAFEFLCHRELEEILRVTRSQDRFLTLLDRARSKHGELVDLLPPVFEEAWRQKDISRRRGKITGEDHRFFLALLLNVPDRTTIFRLVKERFPDQEPVELIVGWVKELSATKIFGSPEANVLGIGEFSDAHLFVFKGLLEDLDLAEIKTRALAEPWAAKLKLSVDELADHIRELPLFKPIFNLELGKV
jgi:hypothetical protein